MKREIKFLFYFILFISLISVTSARPMYMKTFVDFPDEVKVCTTCHVQSSGYGGLNPFGKDFYETGKSLTPELMQLDSDGDLFSNIEELRAGTNPGDSSSTPKEESPGMTAIIAISAITLLVIIRHTGKKRE